MDGKERPDPDVTGLLQAWRGGDRDALDRLATAVYKELRRRAAGDLRRERIGHTLQPTALVNSVATVEREWQAARAWLYARLTGASA